MIERIEWDKLTSNLNELHSPFTRGEGERPLRITFHSQSFTNLSEEDKAAIELLRELAKLKELEAFETSPGDFPHIVLSEPDPKDDFIPVKLMRRDTLLMSTLVWNKRQWPIIAERLVSLNRQNKETVQEMLNVLILAQAHRSVGGDIFITKSLLLLSNRSTINETNPRTPLEAAQLVGLFLRSRNIYAYRAGPKFKASFGQGMFYWILARYHLPNMWRYFSACVAAGKTRGDDIQELGEAVLVRAVRALQARDAIGVQFYVPQNNNTGDQIMYHFDYLTLVLAGAIDAQARVAHRAYCLSTREWLAYFYKKEFRAALAQNGAQELQTLSSKKTFGSLLTLLYKPRNTIHGAALKTFSYEGRSGPRHTLIAVTQPIGQKLLDAGEQLGGAEEWGLTSGFNNEVWLEPYSYATALVKESLAAINEIAAATDVSRLFKDGQPIPPLMEAAPKNSEFMWGKRLSLLA